ncbi:hypothetical protein PCASD_20641 [Puccinia coronata f. sp. avenae]|uniref:Uncharacterized protein n=1 Tax=Puccinia coronata f. sp. avenae TaxID=200324 RepID=A0A2N5UDD5_9BASI|nr:hypothetical protein PCASD_20641 [Puccinia coronata f. sp. avenae]
MYAGTLLFGAGVVPVLVDICKNSHPNQIGTVIKDASNLDGLLYGFTSAFSLFNRVNGLKVFVNRIKEESLVIKPIETVTVLLRSEAAFQQQDDLTNALYGMLVAYLVDTATHKLFPSDCFINEFQVQGGLSILQFNSPDPQGRFEELADMLGSGNNLPTRGQLIKKLERTNTLLGRAKSFGALAHEKFCIKYQTKPILVQPSTSRPAELPGYRQRDPDPQD